MCDSVLGLDGQAASPLCWGPMGASAEVGGRLGEIYSLKDLGYLRPELTREHIRRLLDFYFEQGVEDAEMKRCLGEPPRKRG